MSDEITLQFPARGEYLILARLVASALASRAGMNLEEVDDLRLAVDELCLSVMSESAGSEISLRLTQEGEVVSINCSFTAPLGAEAVLEPDHDAPDHDSLGDLSGELSTRILDALVDEHGRSEDGAGRSAWLRKTAAAR